MGLGFKRDLKGKYGLAPALPVDKIHGTKTQSGRKAATIGLIRLSNAK